MRKVIAARFGTALTNDPLVIKRALSRGWPVEWIDVPSSEFFAASNLGPKWKQYLDRGVLFLLGDDGSYAPPK